MKFHNFSLIIATKFIASLSPTLSSKCLRINPLFKPHHRLYSTVFKDSFKQIDEYINNHKVVIFAKSNCPFYIKSTKLFSDWKVDYKTVDVDVIENGNEILKMVQSKTNSKTFPQIYISGELIGGYNDLVDSHKKGRIFKLIDSHSFDYDLIVLGGGSGGLAASKEAAKLGRKVALLDFVTPSPQGTRWGLGGTCVNVGCIPKKLMHHASLIGQSIKDSYDLGWETNDHQRLSPYQNVKHDWVRMKNIIQDRIKGMNFIYRSLMMTSNIDYINAFGTFEDEHKIKIVNKKNEVKYLTANKFLLATGGRPNYPSDCPGAKEFAITSDDLFSLSYPPGKTLVVGASYVALECAGFLRGLGYDVTVMVRSILLRGFDQEIAEMIGEFMKNEGVKFIRPCVPTSIEQIESGTPGKLKVTAKMSDGQIVTDEYNTVLFGIGRKPLTNNLGLEKIGVKISKNGKIPTIYEQTNVPHIYAVGDILEGKPELTPVAIEAGVLLIRRLFGKSQIQCDYSNVPTTIFTPIEYGTTGYSEEEAIKKFGENNLEVYIQHFTPTEWISVDHPKNKCYAKLITIINENERVVGFHYLGPSAGEVTQFVSLLLKKNTTKSEFDALIGIHPICAEIFTTLSVTKRSGLPAVQAGCCG